MTQVLTNFYTINSQNLELTICFGHDFISNIKESNQKILNKTTKYQNVVLPVRTWSRDEHKPKALIQLSMGYR